MSSANVSVVIPVYNCEKYLAEAIESVLDQSPEPGQVLVVDDGSSDGSSEVAERFVPRVEVVRVPHSGIGFARNAGVSRSSGEYLTFLDSDDLWTPGKLSRQLEAFERDRTLDMVFGQMTQFISPELTEQLAGKVKVDSVPVSAYFPGAMMIRRESFLRVGYFEEGWKVGEYIEWHIRARDLGLRSLLLPEVFLKRRIHEHNQTRATEFKSDYARILARSLARRKKSLDGDGGRES